MENTNVANHNSYLLSSLTQVIDIAICIGIYLGLANMADITFDKDLLKTTILVGMIYTACVVKGGVIFYKSNIKDVQVVLLVLRNVGLFTLGALFLIPLGEFRMLPLSYSLLYVVLLFFASCLFRLSMRLVIKQYRMKEKNRKNVILVGSTENNVNLAHEMMTHPYHGYRVCGYFDFEENIKFSKDCEYLGRPKQVVDYLKHNKINEVYCCLPSRNREVILEIMHYCVKNIVHFYSVPNVSNYIQHRMHLCMLGKVPYLSLYRDPLTIWENRIVKRFIDIAVSLAVLLTVFPIMLIIVTIITKITMPGPIFFCQRRNGLNGKEFTCFKFRSMRINKEADTLQATQDDPRITRWGNIMRHTNIDEFPQFINVLIGNMSIVGPRPHMVKHTKQYSELIDKYMVRHWVKPGITGWSQVTGFRGETKELYQMEGRIEGDIWYIEHWSPWLDIYIIWKTVYNIFHGDKQAF